MKNEIEDLKLQLNYVCYDKEILLKLNKVWESFFKLEEKFNTTHNSDYAVPPSDTPKLPSVDDVMKFNPSLNYDDVQETLHAVYTLGNFA